VRDAAAEQGRIVRGRGAAKGLLLTIRPLQLRQAGRAGAVAEGGVDYIGQPADFGQKVRDEWTANRYHKPADVVLPTWDMSGAREDLKVHSRGLPRRRGRSVSGWKPGNEFKAGATRC
jgi:hypothetical protein